MSRPGRIPPNKSVTPSVTPVPGCYLSAREKGLPIYRNMHTRHGTRVVPHDAHSVPRTGIFPSACKRSHFRRTPPNLLSPAPPVHATESAAASSYAQLRAVNLAANYFPIPWFSILWITSHSLFSFFEVQLTLIPLLEPTPNPPHQGTQSTQQPHRHLPHPRLPHFLLR